nr:MAG TPA: hypothetical protein [Microviridae sp.]
MIYGNDCCSELYEFGQPEHIPVSFWRLDKR